MKKAYVVIGANYGDEGKGLMSRHFALTDPNNSVVIRHNSGAQAGHTIVTDDGRRHVFSHFGSATFDGIPTYLGEGFVSNPMVFTKELAELITKNARPVVFVHPGSRITTPYDVIVNQLLELRRARIGTGRHGSVGAGFGQTIERSTSPHYSLTAADLVSSVLPNKIQAIREYSLRALNGYDPTTDEESRLFGLMSSPRTIEKFFEVCETFRSNTVLSGMDMLHGFDTLVFEGAQGLELDQNNKLNFPHVTRCNTGIADVIQLFMLGMLPKIDVIEACYVSRFYVTKHGAGNLLNETEMPPELQDETNLEHQWQGKMRFAPLDINRLIQRIHSDVDYARSNAGALDLVPTTRGSMAITWLDAVRSNEMIVENDKVITISGSELKSRLEFLSKYQSYGPKNSDVKSG